MKALEFFGVSGWSTLGAAVLFFVQERKQKDIAKILGIGLPLVKYRIRKARELLSAYFGKEDI